MRTTKLTSQEIAELDEMNRKKTRKQGFDLMHIRDRGWGTIQDADGTKLSVLWHTNREPVEGEAIRKIPNGTAVIVKNDVEVAFNVEELQRFLRWA